MAGDDPLGLVGTTIADKYVVEGVVGVGGFAIVYRAMHSLWKRPVAVKVFKALGEVDEKDRAKLLEDFIQEGALLADLSERSTAICQSRDVGMLKAAGGTEVPYMVLEWLEGMPLEAVLQDERVRGLPLRSLEEAVQLLDPAAEALALAHKKGIAHRDVKPANVFVLGNPRGDDASVKLLDFGIAKVVSDAQKMGFGKTGGQITSFTPSYGAPEQFNRSHGATGPWTDVFALALVVVEVISGRDPLDGDTLVQLAFASSDPKKRPTPRTLGRACDDDVEAVFQQALAVKPEDRYQTAGDFWNALRMTVIGRPMSVHITARPDLAPRNSDALAATAAAPETAVPAVAATPSVKKKPPLAAVALGVVALAAIGGTIAFRRQDEKPKKPVMMMGVEAPAVAASCPAGMTKINGGSYFMGSDEKSASPDEKPPHPVKLSPYCLDETEVTVAAYKACTDTGTCLRAGKNNVWPNITAAQSALYDALCNENHRDDRAQHPVNCIDFALAEAYCKQRDARLPTEAEWELAARGFDGRTYPWGDDEPSEKLLNACGSECAAWMKDHPDPDAPIATMFTGDDQFATTAPVGSFPLGKSFFGNKDMAGNVWEWTSDWHGPYENTGSLQTDPKGAATGTDHVIRGGAWNGAQPSWVRPSYRYHAHPEMRSYGIGFRCAKSL